ncbi:hypothetical protein GQ53DRAFT_823710 [Thozetella sp. PMI_491]|nr:hypothetical protein GQ53DRAFT_823710 [Thozetella sp. PMI_491]
MDASLKTSGPTRSPEDEYLAVLSGLSSTIVSFKPLAAFVDLEKAAGPGDGPAGAYSTTESVIKVIEYHEKLPSVVRDINEQQLKGELERDAPHRVFLVENLSPRIILLLGGYLNINPQFFLDYLDAMPDDYDVTAGASMNRLRRGIVPTPWFRFESVEAHTPMLGSRTSMGEHVALQFICPKEFDGNKRPPRNLPDRIQADLTKMNVERVAGLYVPISRDGFQFPLVAMARQCAAVWAGTSNNGSRHIWQVVLLDPSFRTQSSVYGKIKDSEYKPLVQHFMPPASMRPSPHPFPRTRRWIDMLAHYLTCDILGHAVGPPLVSDILRNLVRFIVMEWMCVSTYLERDMNTIEWILERDSLPLESLEEMQKRLFSSRRRIRKYKQLLDLQVTLLRDYLPKQFKSEANAIDVNGVLGSNNESVQALIQARDLIAQSQVRVFESVEFIGSIISVRQGTLSLGHNKLLGFLTILATWGLPFNLLAAVLGMQTEFGYGQSKWNEFIIIACSLAAAISVLFMLYVWFIKGVRSGYFRVKFD